MTKWKITIFISCLLNLPLLKAQNNLMTLSNYRDSPEIIAVFDFIETAKNRSDYDEYKSDVISNLSRIDKLQEGNKTNALFYYVRAYSIFQSIAESKNHSIQNYRTFLDSLYWLAKSNVDYAIMLKPNVDEFYLFKHELMTDGGLFFVMKDRSKLLEKAYSLNAHNPGTLLVLANDNISLEKYDRALHYVDEFLEGDVSKIEVESYLNVLFNRAWLLWTMSREDEAISALDLYFRKKSKLLRESNMAIETVVILEPRERIVVNETTRIDDVAKKILEGKFRWSLRRNYLFAGVTRIEEIGTRFSDDQLFVPQSPSAQYKAPAIRYSLKPNKASWLSVEQYCAIPKAEKKQAIIFVYQQNEWSMLQNKCLERPEVAALLKKFHLVEFDVKYPKDVQINGQVFRVVDNGSGKTHELALALAGGSYPTLSILDTESRLIVSLKGYQKADVLHRALSYLLTDMKTPFDEWSKSYVDAVAD